MSDSRESVTGQCIAEFLGTGLFMFFGTSVLCAAKLAGASFGLPELLARQPGIQMATNGGPGKSTSIFMRGGNRNHTILLIDGMRIGSATTGTASWQDIPLSQIERIEILRGPASAMYGADAVGGVIQIFTKKGEGPALVEAFGGVGTLGTTQLGAGVSGSTGPWSYALRAAEYETSGVSARKGPYPAQTVRHNYNPALDADRDGFRSRTLAARLGYTLAPGHELGLNLIRIDSRNWYDGGGYNARGGADVGNDAATEVIALESRNRLADNWQSTLRLAQSKDESTGFRSTSRYNSKQEQLLWQNDIKLAVGSLMLAYEHLEQSADSTTTSTRRYCISATSRTSAPYSWAIITIAEAPPGELPHAPVAPGRSL